MAIAFVQKGVNDDSAVTTLVVTPPASFTAGNTLVVHIGSRTSGQSTPQVTDVKITGGASLTQGTPINDPNDTRDNQELWYVLSCAAGVSVTITLANSSNVAATVVEYSGVAAMGVQATPVSGTTGTRSISITTQDANNYISAGFGDASSSAGYTAVSGTTRQTPFRNNQGSLDISAMDNTAASASSVTCSYTITTPIQYLACAIELRSTTGGGGGIPILVSRSQIVVPGPRRMQIIQT